VRCNEYNSAPQRFGLLQILDMFQTYKTLDPGWRKPRKLEKINQILTKVLEIFTCHLFECFI